jgi:arginyl-tRNA synthetase
VSASLPVARSFDGNSAGYLQMAHARIRSILRKAPDQPPTAATVRIGEPAEHALALDLLTFPTVVEQTAATLEFHRLAGYLHRLATSYTMFWEQCPVLRAEADTRTSRLALCELTGRVLHVGLGLLGIIPPDRM